MSVVERIKQVIAAQGLTNSAFAIKMGMLPSNLSGIICGARKPGPKFFARMEKIGVNAYWLQTGEGEMMLDECQAEAPENDSCGDKADTDAELVRRGEQIFRRDRRRRCIGKAKHKPLIELCDALIAEHAHLESRISMLERRISIIEEAL